MRVNHSESSSFDNFCILICRPIILIGYSFLDLLVGTQKTFDLNLFN